MASVACTRVAVPPGPKTGNGFGWRDMIQRVVTTSLKSVMWSLCKCVRNTARSAAALAPAAAARISTARPQSKRRSPADVRTSVDAPARSGSGKGTPLPRMTVCMGPS